MTPEEWECCAEPEKMLAFLRGRASERKLRLFAVACCRRVVSRFAASHHRHEAQGFFAGAGCREGLDVRERHADGLATEEAAAHARGVVGDLFNHFQYDAAHPADVDTVGCQLALGALTCDDPSDLIAWAAAAAGYDALARTPDAAVTSLADDYLCGRRDYLPPRWEAEEDAVRAAQTYQAGYSAERVAQLLLLRCLVANPFRPLSGIEPAVLAYNDGSARRLAEAIYEGRRLEDLPVLADLLEEAGCVDPDLLGHLRGPGPHVLGCHALDAVLGKS